MKTPPRNTGIAPTIYGTIFVLVAMGGAMLVTTLCGISRIQARATDMGHPSTRLDNAARAAGSLVASKTKPLAGQTATVTDANLANGTSMQTATTTADPSIAAIGRANVGVPDTNSTVFTAIGRRGVATGDLAQTVNEAA